MQYICFARAVLMTTQVLDHNDKHITWTGRTALLQREDKCWSNLQFTTGQCYLKFSNHRISAKGLGVKHLRVKERSSQQSASVERSSQAPGEPSLNHQATLLHSKHDVPTYRTGKLFMAQDQYLNKTVNNLFFPFIVCVC